MSAGGWVCALSVAPGLDLGLYLGRGVAAGYAGCLSVV